MLIRRASSFWRWVGACAAAGAAWCAGARVASARVAVCAAACVALCAATCKPACAAASAAADEPTTDTAPRIVSLSPHITELLFAAGAGPRIVGVDDSSDYPADAMHIPRLGEAAALDVEGLLRLNPTLVVVWETGSPPRLRAELERLKLRVVVTEQRTLDDIGNAIIEFGRLAGTATAAADAAQRYRSELAELRSRYAGRPRVKVFYQVWDRPLYTLSGKHVVSEVISLCGGDNIFAEMSTPAPAVDREAVIARDPEVILIGAAGLEGTRQAEQWNRFSSLQAVRNHRIFTLDPSLIGRMAPRILQGVQAVCASLDASRAGPAVSNIRQSPDDIFRR
jgi:iron complex transport system substrate-binding protein